MAKVTKLFIYKDCRFKIEKGKLNTARVVCWNELKITNSFTYEVSMFGKSEEQLDTSQKIVKPLEITDLHNMGSSFLLSLIQYNNFEPELEQEF